jgi:hypothetical protein
VRASRASFSGRHHVARAGLPYFPFLNDGRPLRCIVTSRRRPVVVIGLKLTLLYRFLNYSERLNEGGRAATEDEELRGYGDPYGNAEAMALKSRCVEIRPGPEFLSEVSTAIYYLVKAASGTSDSRSRLILFDDRRTVPPLPGNHRIHGSSFPLERLPVVRAEHCRPRKTESSSAHRMAGARARAGKRAERLLMRHENSVRTLV